MNRSSLTLFTKDIALIGLMVAVIEVCKVALSFLPNIELTTFWIIIFSLYFKKKILFVIPVFILIEGAIYGFGLWWLMYLYAWSLLVLITQMLRFMDSAVGWSILSGLFGLSFGFLCAFPYIFIGAADGGLISGLRLAFAWWVAGIPWDVVHGVGNFFIMLVLYRPVTNIMKKVSGAA